jgi:hypothetical protein
MSASGGAPGGPLLVDAVICSEFDIDKGSTCRTQYPREVGDAALLAELMLPEGCHNRFQDWTIFTLNRPESRQQTEKSGGGAGGAGGESKKRWRVHAYRYEAEQDDAGWALVEGGSDTSSSSEANTVTLEVETAGLEKRGGSGKSQEEGSAEGRVLFIIAHLGGGETLRVQHHGELQYSALQPDFASMYTLDGDAVGFHFRTAEQQRDFQAALTRAAAAVSNSPMLWCLNHVSNRRDASVRRGAQVKALAICSRYRFIHVWEPVLLLAVDRMFSLSTG